MKKESQSTSDERIRQLNERYAELRVELAEQFREKDRQLKETDRQLKETDRQLKDMIKETDRKITETDRQFKEAKEMIIENGKQIGGLGNKFGGYTEAMARPSIRRILEKRFEADFLGSIRFKSTKETKTLEIDAWGLSRNGTGAAYIVETKSRFRDRHIEQVLQLVERFRYYMSDYEKRAVYPMLAVVEISEEGRRKVWNAGIHLIDINDGVFKYATPPEDFVANGYHGVYGVQRGVPHLRLVVGGDQKQRGAG